MAITAADIKQVVLNEDDFGHEMRVGGILDTLNYTIRGVYIADPVHGETYDDPKTQKARQFDYRCRITASRGRQVISLAIECKNLNPDLPLVICGRARTAREAFHALISSNSGNPEVLKINGDNSIYKPHGFVGKSILRLKMKERKLCSDGDSEIYDRWSQALASSHELAEEASRNPQEPNSSTFVLPMVVVPNGSLWTVQYDKSGNPSGDPMQADHCEFHVAHKMDAGILYVVSHIHFLTLEGLKSFIGQVADIEDFRWGKIFSGTAMSFKQRL